MQLTGRHKDLEHLAGHRTHDALARNFGAYDRMGVDNGHCRSGEQNFVTCLKTRIRTHLNVCLAAQYPLDDNPPSDLFFDLAYGPACRH